MADRSGPVIAPNSFVSDEGIAQLRELKNLKTVSIALPKTNRIGGTETGTHLVLTLIGRLVMNGCHAKRLVQLCVKVSVVRIERS
jgi:hypothetical protein